MGAGASDWSERFASAPIDAMQVYEDILVPGLFIPWAKLLLDAVGVAPGEAVLDVACGPGTVTRLAAERVGRDGRVVGADISAAMLTIARSKPAPEGSHVDYVETSAAPLAVGTAEYDVVVCQQGLQFFPDRRAALLEMARVTRPNGRIGIAVWANIEQLPAFAGLMHAIADALGADVATRYESGPWGLPSLADLAAEVAATGLAELRAEARSIDVVFKGGAARFAETLAASPVAADVAALDAAGRKRLADAVAEHLGPLEVGGDLHSPTVSNIVVARV